MRIAIIGMQGAGKTSAAKMLELYGYGRVITCTTRPPRDGEVDGIDYHFLSTEDFLSLADGNRMAEYSIQNGYYHGVKYDDIPKPETDSVLIVDPYGLIELQKKGIRFNLVVYLAPSDATRINRLIKRGDDFETIKRREELERVVFKAAEEQVIFDISIKNDLSVDETVKIILDEAGKSQK